MALLSEKNFELKQKDGLSEIKSLDDELYKNFSGKFRYEGSLSRSLVSFQANKSREIYRWYKFKEGFSASLIEYFLDRYNIMNIYSQCKY